MVALLAGGIGLILIGLGAIAYGIPINEFGLGNTLIVSGTIAVCSGALLLGMAAVIRELRRGASFALGGENVEPILPAVAGRAPLLPSGSPVIGAPTVAAMPPPVDLAVAPQPSGGTSGDEANTGTDEPTESATKPRRNLLFQSTSRRERERAQARAGQPPEADASASTIEVNPSERTGPSFDDAWPQPGASRPPPRSRPTPPAESAVPSRRPATPDQPDVTVIKSGIVDGMAYSLYSDGSIEAQLAEGTMRFASIDELRQHLDQRG